MKNVITKSIIAIGLFSLWACKQETPTTTETKEVATEKVDTYPFGNTHNVNADTASNDICRNQIRLEALGIKNPVKAFLVSKYDLCKALGISTSTPSKVDYVRCYLGLTRDDRAKLYLTPVVGAKPLDGNGGNDSLLMGEVPGGDGTLVPIVLDLNFPCPNLCSGGGSVLNKACVTTVATEKKP